MLVDVVLARAAGDLADLKLRGYWCKSGSSPGMPDLIDGVDPL